MTSKSTIKVHYIKKNSHSNLDTTDIICYYKYKFVYIIIILKVNNICCFVGVRMEMIIIQCKYTTHYTYNTILYTLYCCFCYYALHTIHVDQDEMKLELVNIA